MSYSLSYIERSVEKLPINVVEDQSVGAKMMAEIIAG
ncbi:hypothetical protein C8N47_13422, partial [Mangrovibacterium marinum]